MTREESAVRAHFKSTHGDSAAVARPLAPYGKVHLHPGVFPQSAASFGDLRFSFVHLDMDLPASTSDGLAFFVPRLVPGGILIGDDFEDAGVQSCFATYFEQRDDLLVPLPWGQVMVVRQRDRDQKV